MQPMENLDYLERDLAQVFGHVQPDADFVQQLEAELAHELSHLRLLRAWALGTALLLITLSGGVALWLGWRSYRRMRRTSP